MTTDEPIPMNLDLRNIKDQFKDMEPQEIADFLYGSSSELTFVFMNVAGDFNKSTGVRNLSFFNGRQVLMCGKSKWDRRGAVGANHYIRVDHLKPVRLDYWINKRKHEGWRIVACENNITNPAIPLTEYKFQPKTIVFFGEETDGLSQQLLTEYADDIVEIVGFGPMRSLNVGTASGIIAYEYDKQLGSINE